MKKGFFKSLTIFVIALCFFLIGCGNNKTSSNEEQNTSTNEKGKDNYKKIIKRNKDNGKLSIYFLDLDNDPKEKDKSGDCSILIFPDGKVMMIDCGHPCTADTIKKVLKDLKIKKIDYFVNSHPHIDHLGSFPALSNTIEIGQVYCSYIEYPTSNYNNFVNAIKEKNIPVVNLKEGDKIDFGDLHVEIFNPPKDIVYPENYPENSTQFVNDQSVTMKFTYGESSVLFAGDLYISAERDLLAKYGDRLQADVIKANHHGNDTSNQLKWIKTVNPKIVATMNDVVGSMTVYNNYIKNGTTKYRHTMYNGIIKVVLDDKANYELTTQFDSWMKN